MTTMTGQLHITRRARRKVVLSGPAPKPAAPVCHIPRASTLLALAIRFDPRLFESNVTDQSELASPLPSRNRA